MDIENLGIGFAIFAVFGFSAVVALLLIRWQMKNDKDSFGQADGMDGGPQSDGGCGSDDSEGSAGSDSGCSGCGGCGGD